jgi:hypothetical protein
VERRRGSRRKLVGEGCSDKEAAEERAAGGRCAFPFTQAREEGERSSFESEEIGSWSEYGRGGLPGLIIELDQGVF